MRERDRVNEARGAARGAVARNETYKHLEDPLRLGPFTLLQWTGVCASFLAAVVFGLYLSPLPPGATMAVAFFFTGLPLALSYAVSGWDMAINRTVRAVYQWRRDAKHYLPGPAEPVVGYVVAQPDEDERLVARPAEDLAAARRQLEGAWDL
jgi:hypothetical protein